MYYFFSKANCNNLRCGRFTLKTSFTDKRKYLRNKKLEIQKLHWYIFQHETTPVTDVRIALLNEYENSDMNDEKII